MERNIGDQLNKAFEAYRQVSIEKEIAKKELQKMTDYYEGYTRKLQKQIEDQQRLISVLEAKLSALRQPPEMKCEPCEHLHDGIGAYKNLQYQDNSGAVTCNVLSGSTVECQEMQDAFEAIQAKFRNIKSLTRRQKDHLKKLSGGNDTFNDQRFSMPIQCTDRTAEAERPFSSGLRATAAANVSSLASRGGGSTGEQADPEDRDLDSLTKFSVKFPPPADSEYDFLNSAPERHVVMGRVLAAAAAKEEEVEEETVELPLPFVYPTSPAHSTSSSLSQESVRGPQQPLWSPELCNAGETAADLASPHSPDKCAFCHAVVPPDRMNMHLYSHFSHKADSSQ